MNERLRPRERIRKKKDFISLYRNGWRFRGRHFHLVYLPNQLGFSRFAVVVGKKVGGAVLRNRIKRWLRELFRRNKSEIAKPADLVIIARRDIRNASREEIKAGYLSALQQIFKQRTSL